MILRVFGTIGTFLLVFLGLMYEVGDFNVEEFFIFLGLGSIAGLIAWFKLFKPSPRRKGN
jgi:membrane protein DedA with SNARE-associated domain